MLIDSITSLVSLILSLCLIPSVEKSSDSSIKSAEEVDVEILTLKYYHKLTHMDFQCDSSLSAESAAFDWISTFNGGASKWKSMNRVILV